MRKRAEGSRYPCTASHEQSRASSPAWLMQATYLTRKDSKEPTSWSSVYQQQLSCTVTPWRETSSGQSTSTCLTGCLASLFRRMIRLHARRSDELLLHTLSLSPCCKKFFPNLVGAKACCIQWMLFEVQFNFYIPLSNFQWVDRIISTLFY